MRIDIQSSHQDRPPAALLERGFRPFFLGAAIFSVVSMSLWFTIYFFKWNPGLAGLSPVAWHAHEMIYGYATAVIAGFLLTAVRNWTGVQTLHGAGLAGLLALWLLVRVLLMVDTGIPLVVIAVLENLFILLLFVALVIPVIRTRNWRQLSVLTKLLFLLASNILFYLGVLDIIPEGVNWGILSGLYLVIGLVLMLGRRVIPFFITKGIGYEIQVRNRRWVDIASVVLFILFWFFASFTTLDIFSAVLAAALLVVLSFRLWDWYTPGLWKKPLLWILYLAYGFIVLGFLLTVLGYASVIAPYLAVHAFAAGGVGLMTLGMMARVSLGHTGRNIHMLPTLLPLALIVTAAAALIRVVLPLFLPDYDNVWIGVSQLLWVSAFMLFLWIYTPILIAPRL